MFLIERVFTDIYLFLKERWSDAVIIWIITEKFILSVITLKIMCFRWNQSMCSLVKAKYYCNSFVIVLLSHSKTGLLPPVERQFNTRWDHLIVYCPCLSKDTSEGILKPGKINPKTRKPIASNWKQNIQKRPDTFACARDSPSSTVNARNGADTEMSVNQKIYSVCLSFSPFAKFCSLQNSPKI